MPFDTCPDLLVDESPASRRISATLSILAVIGIAGSLLIASASRFSEQHLADRSPLRWVVDALSLYGQWPTLDGKEIRLTIFNLAAAMMLLAAGIRLLTQNAQPRMALDDLLDFRARASSPVTWGVFFLFCSFLSSAFSESRRLTLGESVLHGFQGAWVLPLALLLEPRHARTLARLIVWILSVTSVIGLWYYFARVYPQSGFAVRLKYPTGSELSLAACLLPVPFIAIGLLAGQTTGALASRVKQIFCNSRLLLTIMLVVPVIAAFAIARSRSGAVGVAFGVATMIALHLRGRGRRTVLIATAVLVAGTGFWVTRERHKTDSWLRSHSLRARMDFAWPYATALWRTKPILGHGDGAYGLLAGQFARVDQIDDPKVMSFGSEQIWLQHADSEPLQLLADLGFVGFFAAVAALGTALITAARFCDAARASPAHAGDRGLVIGLTAALVAIAAEECSSNGLRINGLPAVFLSTSAILWTLVRRHRPPREVAQPDHWMPGGVLRMAGLGITGVALALTAAAWMDAAATRSCYRASSALISGHNDEAVIEADRAARGSLGAYQQLKARLFAVWAMSQEFDTRLKSQALPGNEDFTVASAALGRLATLETLAPRFLRTASLRVELFANLARAAERRNDPGAAVDFAKKRNQALARLIADEPFRMEPVQALLQAEPQIAVMERLAWLRRLLRGGEMPRGFVDLFMMQAQTPDFVDALNDLMNVAAADAKRVPENWQDRLSPETLRLTALTLELQGKPTDAIPVATAAVEMYEAAGARLFSANGAARHECVRLRFAANPTSEIAQRLQELADAARLAEMSIRPDGALPDPMGSTRLDLLLAGGREDHAAAQVRLLSPSASIPAFMATAYLSLASSHAQLHRDAALQWATRATELAPQAIGGHAVLLELMLRAGQEKSASTHLKLMAKSFDVTAISELEADLRSRYPQSQLWANPAKTGG